ncbi:MAG TPA: NAD+ synthase [Candidatus Bathyarchaeia archaeon]|nr:NAD+ synthase [Candidatus Bathyarchaeia archaeon]
MRLTPSVLELDLPEVEKRITRFIKEYVEKSGADGIVLGLSGGVDSNTIAALSSLSISGERVMGLLLPEQETYNQKDISDAMTVADKFGLKTQVCDITPVLKSVYKTIPIFDHADKLCKGNIKARTRMIYLYYYANKLNRIVCGSSDKSETMMGYFTKWGDVAADISPIMDLYKTQVRKLAEHLGVPKELATKPSTPALWPEQFAETELGIKYETLDLILYGLERFMNQEEISLQLKVDEAIVKKVKNKWLAAEHKRRVLLAPKLGFRTVGTDFRLPRSAW